MVKRNKKSIFESEKVGASIAPLKPLSQQISIVFPELGWDLRKAGYNIDPVHFLSVAMFIALLVSVFSMIIIVAPLAVRGSIDIYIGFLGSLVLGMLSFFYILLIPKTKIARTGRQIDKHLEYMLKDIEVQLTAGIPLFDALVNIARGDYGECSTVCNKVVQEVQSGKSMINVLDEFGLLTPSEYLRRVFWQIVNALKTGSNVTIALRAISNDIRVKKENSIRVYAQELSLLSLIYMMFVIVLPSMGITLLLILSSFLRGTIINEFIFFVVLFGIVFFQLIFISLIRSKRPDVG